MTLLRTHCLRRFLLPLALCQISTTVFAVEPISPKGFQSLHALIKPKPSEEKWAQIPWLASLWEGRRRAAAEGKPILLWEMDGHPLGCT